MSASPRRRRCTSASKGKPPVMLHLAYGRWCSSSPKGKCPVAFHSTDRHCFLWLHGKKKGDVAGDVLDCYMYYTHTHTQCTTMSGSPCASKLTPSEGRASFGSLQVYTPQGRAPASGHARIARVLNASMVVVGDPSSSPVGFCGLASGARGELVPS